MDSDIVAAENAVSPHKEAIIEVAQTLFAQHGYEGLSIRDLAEQCGLAKATIYHHFRDKQDLFLSVLDHNMRTMQAHVIAAADAQQGAPERLRAMVAAYCRVIGERRSDMMFHVQASSDVQSLIRTYIAEHRGRLLLPWQEVIQQGIDEGAFRPLDIQMSVVALIGMLHTAVTYQMFLNDRPFDADSVDQLLDLYLRGIHA